ncbi:MAG: glycosyl transferase family 90, partial [Pseudomonadota bacterium]
LEAIDNAKRHLRQPLSQAEMLRSKYLLALEGNDVASGLKWMLLSNSAVLMPAPRIVSWACETELRPFVHYVPVSPDLTDLEAVFHWCLQNEDLCKTIAENGRVFAEVFMDEAQERALTQETLHAYLKSVTLVLPQKHRKR